MHPLVENFLERPLRHKLAFWIASLVVMILVFWQYFYKANWEELQNLNEQVASLNSQIVDQQRIARELPKFREETAVLDGKLSAVLRELPDKKEIEGLLKQVSALAVDTGLEVTKFAPQNEVYRDFFAELPVVIELGGTFHQLATFFDEVGHLTRIVNIRNIGIDIDTETKDAVLIRASCVATSFRYLDENERAALAPAAETQKGRRRGATAEPAGKNK